MGLFSDEQKAVIESGVFYVRQKWELWFQTTPGGAWSRSVTIDNQTPSGTRRVIDAGSREIECYNQSLRERGDLRDGNYEFSVDNHDGYFNIGKLGSIWHYVPFVGDPEMLDPSQGLLEHKIYLMVDGSWEELTFVTFRALIKDIVFESVSDSSGDSVSHIARFICKNKGFSNVNDRLWTSEDGTETNLSSTFTGVADAAT